MAYKVTYKRSNLELEYCPEKHKHLSLLDLAFDQSLFLKAGCRSGYCGTCQYSILSGEVKYFYDPPPIPADSGAVLICSCYPVSDVVLDA